MRDRRLRMLLALGEGRPLRGRQRALARELEADAALMASLEAQRQVLAALKAAGPAPSPALGARLRQTVQGADPRLPWLPAAPRSRALTPVVAAAATALVALAVIIAGSSTGPVVPSAARVSRVWMLPGTGRPVTAAAGNPAQLGASDHGIVFPNYRDQEGWHPVGLRHDRIGAVQTTTVVYMTGARRATYTVVPATRLRVPAQAARERVGHLHLRVFRAGEREVVTFQRAGATCVLAAAAPRERQWLIRLATWHGGPTTHPA